MWHKLNLIILSTSLVACSLAPDYTRPKTKLPNSYRQQSQIAQEQGKKTLKLWSDLFKDPILNKHITIAINANYELGISLSRVDEARALLGFTRADQFPRLDLQGGAGRIGSSRQAAFDQGHYNAFALGGLLSYELDLWGRYADASKSQRAQLAASEFNYQTAYITLVSAVAETYFLILDLDQRLKISQSTYSNRKKATETLRRRFEGGTIPLLDVNQAETQEAIALAEIAALRREVRQAENAFCILLGQMPQSIERTVQADASLIDTSINLNQPLSLLEHRPDVKAAEEILKSAESEIGVARAQRLPNISIAAALGLESADSSDLFRSDARSWNVLGDLFGPIFDFGKARFRVEASRERAKQAQLNYQQVVLTALREVEDSMIAVESYQQEYQARDQQAIAARSATKLARARYEEGVSPYLEVLDIERSLFQAELAESQAKGAHQRSLARLYRSLGGVVIQQ